MNRLFMSAYLDVQRRLRDAREFDRERGLTTTEIAVLTFVLVTAAVIVGGILISYASDTANSLPDDPTAEIQTGT